jgi:hypothetical protein
MHEQLWDKVSGLDPADVAVRTRCRFENDAFTVPFAGRDYTVAVGDRRVTPADSPDEPAGYLEQLCILAYLINAQDIPLAHRLVGGEKLEAGQFFFRGHHALPTRKLEAAFGDEPGRLFAAGDAVGAERSTYGDASISIRVLPNVPVVFVIWGRDDEFEARASILFDETAARQLPLDALLAAVQLTVKRLVEAAGPG